MPLLLSRNRNISLFAEVGASSASCEHGRSCRVLLSDRGFECSGFASRALDPIATAKVEKLIYPVRENYTIVMVSHNMQQAGRCLNYTALLFLGPLIEFGSSSKIFTNPAERQTEDSITGRFG